MKTSFWLKLLIPLARGLTAVGLFGIVYTISFWLICWLAEVSGLEATLARLTGALVALAFGLITVTFWMVRDE